MKLINLLLFFCFLPSTVFASEVLSKSNWMSHPEIKKIRVLWHSINKLEKFGKLINESKKCASSGGSFETEGAILKDQKGIIRKYVVDAGSGDSVGHAEYYYDGKGTHRFTHKTRKASNGTKKVVRIYYDENHKILYSDINKEGPGWPGSDLDDSVENPISSFAALCDE